MEETSKTPKARRHFIKRSKFRKLKKSKDLQNDIKGSVVNISNFVPTVTQLNLLSKGLSFCPRANAPDDVEILTDVLKFDRNVRLKHHFRNSDQTSLPTRDVDTMYRESKGWTPPAGKNVQLDRFLSVLTLEALSYKHPGNGNNLSAHEAVALKELRDNPKIVIKPADKGGAVVIWGVEEYKSEAARQLSDRNFYRKVGRDNTSQIAKEINREIQLAFKNKHISVDQKNYFIVEDPRTPCFYMLPKIHKKGNPGRPIVSACGGPTSNLSAFIDEHLKTVVKTIPSYLQDTTDFLSKLAELDLPTDYLLATVDVTSLYTNIPVAEGITAVGHAFMDQTFSTPIPQLLHFLKLVLGNNEFEFDAKYYKQIKGCAMGTPCAPNFANIFMCDLETRLLRDAPGPVPHIWWRYIDDIFIIWTHSAQEFETFLTYINGFHQSIKFTAEVSDTSVNFLDVQVVRSTHGVTTQVFSKPTDAHLYLHYSSNHPSSTKKAIPFSQALRFRKICSTLEIFDLQVESLLQYFLKRGYPRRILDLAISKARAIPRNTLLKVKAKVNSSKVVGVHTYGIHNFTLKPHIDKHSKVLSSHPDTVNLVKNGFLIAHRQPPNLRSMLVTSRFLSSPKRETKWGNKPCSKNCINCPYMDTVQEVSSTRNQRVVALKGHFDCESTNVVYIITCNRCKIQYIGETKNMLKTRMTQHRSDIIHKAHERVDQRDKPVARHFNSGGHVIKDLRVTIARRNNSWDTVTRRLTERAFIQLFQTVAPHGLNLFE